MDRDEYIRQEARKELARRFFYDYCILRYPKFYRPERTYLMELCSRMQTFIEQNEKRFLVVNIGPRFGKSLTGGNFAEWLFGRDNMLKVMTGSYNETLSTTFARKVRDTIVERPSDGVTVYSNIFPATAIKYGQASAHLWALEGSSQDNYLATSPTGTATGFGANVVIIDDVIKNAEEAYNELVLDKHWDWFTNTMMQRLEGDDWKVIIIMTRWAAGDLAGRILASYDDVELITFKAVNDDGTMLCDTILNERDFKLKTQEMNPDIIEANYNQQPIDIKGRLYEEFKTYSELPTGKFQKSNYTDTADKGTDFLCSVNYIDANGDVYVTDVVMSDEDMEVTEPLVAESIHVDGVGIATFESNNGGRGYARNIERLLAEKYSNRRCVILWKTQIKNKEARILASSAWVTKHVFMPENWRNKWPVFYSQLMKYQRKGKNAHDDAPDVLAAIYEAVANTNVVEWASADDMG